MRRRIHLVVGTALFLVYAYILGKVHPESALLLAAGFLGVVAGSAFPDLIEPATNSRHRGLFHSRRILRLTSLLFFATAFLSILRTPVLFSVGAFPVSCFLLGYASHLLADSLTRAGLPS